MRSAISPSLRPPQEEGRMHSGLRRIQWPSPPQNSESTSSFLNVGLLHPLTWEGRRGEGRGGEGRGGEGRGGEGRGGGGGEGRGGEKRNKVCLTMQSYLKTQN